MEWHEHGGGLPQSGSDGATQHESLSGTLSPVKAMRGRPTATTMNVVMTKGCWLAMARARSRPG